MQLRSRWGWWVLWAALCVALAPTISHAVAFAKGATNTLEICTPTGPRFVELPSGISTDTPLRQESARTLEHCPLCLHPTDRVAPPPCRFDFFWANDDAPVHTVWQAVFFATEPHRWGTSRGPPALS